VVGINRAAAQDSLAENRIVINGYVKDMATAMFSDMGDEWMTSNLVHNRINLKWLISDRWTSSLEVRNRWVNGKMVRDIPGYGSTLSYDNGYVSLSKNIIDEKSSVLNSAIDRLWVEYAGERWVVRVGRQRINWSQTFVWNPNDVFNSYSYLDFDYEERAGSDAVRVQYLSGAVSGAELAVKVNRNKQVTAAAMYRTNSWNYDFQALTGIVDDNDWVTGIGWSGELWDGGFRGEASWFHPINTHADNADVFVASIGYDYTFKKGLFLQFEALYNGNKEAMNELSINQFTQSQLDVKHLFLSDVSVFGAVSYSFTPLISGSLSGIVNPPCGVVIIIPSANVSLMENLELTLTGQLMRSLDNNGIEPVNMMFGRLKFSF
jgi:hypothetical protein